MLSFLGGVFYFTFFGFELFGILLSFALFLVFLFSFFEKRDFFILGIFFLMFLFGGFWYQSSIPKNLELEKYVGKNLQMEVSIISEPELKGDKQKFVVKTKEGEKILINTQRYPEYEYGNLILLKGKLEEPKNFSGFNYKAYLAKDDIYFLMRNPDIELLGGGGGSVVVSALFKVKNAFEQNIKTLLPSPESDFINGILFGSKSEIPEKLYNDFIKTGTAHIIALSGFNITIIVIFLAWILGYFFKNQKIVVVSAIVVIILFVIMTGASSSVVRAALMGSVLLLARYYGRAKHSLNALVFAALLMVLFNPKILVFDVSFQLSFLATLGLLYIYPYFKNKFTKIPDFFSLRDTVSATLSAQIAVLPILLYNFKQVSLIAPVVNVLILPLIPPAMLLGFLAGLIGFFSMMAAKVFAFFLWIILFYQIKVIEFFGGLSFSSLTF